MSEPRLTHLKLYLQRLGFDAPPPPTLATLRQLQLRHTAVFVFENLATVTGAPVLIDLPSIEEKSCWVVAAVTATSSTSCFSPCCLNWASTFARSAGAW